MDMCDTATHCNALQRIGNALQRIATWDATHCNALQRTATHCNVQRTAPRNALQHTTHRNMFGSRAMTHGYV